MGRLFILALLLVSAGCVSTTGGAKLMPKPIRSVDTIEVLSMLSVYAEFGRLTNDFEVPGDAAATRWLSKLEQAVINRGLDVLYSGLSGHLGGTDGTTAIVIEKRQSPNSRLSTLLHEYAHVLGCRGPAKMENEVCAETSSFLAAHALGFDTRAQSFNYLLLRVDQATRERVLWRDRAKIAGIVAIIRNELQ